MNMDKSLPEAFLNENKILQFLVFPKFRWYRHLLLILPISLVLYNSGTELGDPTLNLLFFFLLFYTNMNLLVPKLLFRNKYVLYCLSVLATIILSTSIYLGGYYLLDTNFNLEGVNIPLFCTLIFVLIAASSSIKLFQKWILDKQLIFELERSKTSSELEQLKNQINPHFLFNMLNNANVLTKKDPEKASQVLVKLGDLLRYQLYDSAREKVFLTSDIHFLEDFLNLEKVRRDNFDFLISKEGELNGIQIPPLLFISFVENAVKHNNDPTKPSYVNLYFTVINNELYFKCINSKPVLKSIKRTTGGLGLANVKRRLELLFPAAHTLRIEDTRELYSVTLMLQL